MQVRHNTALLEQALEQVIKRASIPILQAEALALERTNRSFAIRRIATGAAVAIGAIGVGLGIYFAYLAPQGKAESKDPIIIAEEKDKAGKREKSNPPPVPEPIPPQPPSQPQPDGRPPTVDFTKFVHRDVKMGERKWVVTAGHHFEREEAKSWQTAWCYTQTQVNGITVKVQLAERISPQARPKAPAASQSTIEAAGLSVSEAFMLAAKCSWLDRQFSVDELELPPGRQSPLTDEPLRTSLSNRALTVSGAIDAKFTDIISKFDFDKLEIESPGGLIDEAMEAGRYLRASGKDVQAIRSCLSACVFVLSGGLYRDAAPDARVGVHRFKGKHTTDKDIEIAQLKSSEIITYLEQMGVAIDVFHEIARVPADSIGYLTRGDMQKWRLINGARPVAGPLPPRRSRP